MSDQLEQEPTLAPTSEEGFVDIADSDDSQKIAFSIYDAMLAVAMVCVALAVVLLFFELRDFGNFPFVFPWKTSEVLEGGG